MGEGYAEGSTLPPGLRDRAPHPSIFPILAKASVSLSREAA